MKILIVEDELKLASFLRQGLEENDYAIDLVYDGKLGLSFSLKNDYDLILLDIILPYINGLELCKQIKDVKPNTPILMLTALGATDDKLTGFDAGADDYLVKPFEFKELLARIKSLTKRNAGRFETSKKIKISDLELDLDKKCAMRGQKPIDLTAKEYALLEFFMRNTGRVISRSEIAEKVWDINFDTGTNVVDVYVNILRKKIDKNFDDKLIHTRIGMGYIFNNE